MMKEVVFSLVVALLGVGTMVKADSRLTRLLALIVSVAAIILRKSILTFFQMTLGWVGFVIVLLMLVFQLLKGG